MGTRFEVLLAEGVRDDLRAAGEAALEEIEIWHRRLSRFAADSLVSHLNRTANGTPVRLDAEAFGLFDEALSVWRASGGAFDVACGTLVALHGFAPSMEPADNRRASSAAVALDPDEWTIRFTQPGVSIDLGAIGKGHALDCAAKVLRTHGVTSALVHGGTSSVVAIGAPPQADGWRVALAGSWQEPVQTLRDSAMATSCASSQRSSSGAGHIVDPRDGSAASGTGRVAVVGPSARLADAWATALAVLGSVPATFPTGYQAFFEDQTTT